MNSIMYKLPTHQGLPIWGDLEGYFGARYYDSRLCIWLSPDPLADEYPHQSPYVYCSNNPINRVDPNGMWDDWYLNLYTGGIEYFQGSENLFDQGYINIAPDGASMADIEYALSSRNYNFMKDPTFPGGYRVDTEMAWKGWVMMQTFSPEVVGTLLCMATPNLGSMSSSSVGLSNATPASTATRGGTFGERLFLSERFGITSTNFGNSAANAQGLLNQGGGIFKAGWSTGQNSAGLWGYKFRIGLGANSANPNIARYHMYVPKSFVPNSFANPSIQLKRSIYNLKFKF